MHSKLVIEESVVSELKILLSHIKQANPKSVVEVKEAADGYFEEIVWSVLKDEWNVMTSEQKDEFVKTVFNNIIK